MQATEGSGPRTCEGDQMDARHPSVAAVGGSWVWCASFGAALPNNSEAFLGRFFFNGDQPDECHLLTLDTMQFRGCELPTVERMNACHLFRLFKLGSSVSQSNKPVEVRGTQNPHRFRSSHDSETPSSKDVLFTGLSSYTPYQFRTLAARLHQQLI